MRWLLARDFLFVFFAKGSFMFRRQSLLVEMLERRTMLSGGSVDYHDVAYLTIQGTSAHDDIEVTVTDWSNPQVRDWHVEFNGESYSFATPLIMNLDIH